MTDTRVSLSHQAWKSNRAARRSVREGKGRNPMNIKDIAQPAGVSTSAVSKIVNHKDSSITAATCDRVLEVVRKYHYTPYGSSKPNTAA